MAGSKGLEGCIGGGLSGFDGKKNEPVTSLSTNSKSISVIVGVVCFLGTTSGKLGVGKLGQRRQ